MLLKSGIIISVLIGVGLAAVFGLGIVTEQGGAQESDTAGRLANHVMPYGYPEQTCYYDALVGLERGEVARVEKAGDARGSQVQLGRGITDLASDTARLEKVIPMPVHVDEDGDLRPGYAFCEEGVD